MLEVLNIEAGYGRIPVLRGVSLEVKNGEIITLIGGNGAGKSTLMKTICGILFPAAGSIVYSGSAIHRKKASTRVKSGLVLVPEGRRILRRMSVCENLLMGAYTRRDKQGVRSDMEEVFSRFPVLKERKDLPADVLSGGEQQMLAIGRALLARPRLLMMDEPSLGLSPILVNRIFSIIDDLHSSGITILLVEQNARKALEVADRGYVMETGRIVMCDTAECLLRSESLHEAYLGRENKEV
ncbi:MAG: ABC transporter ATP-binding protein [Desulfobacterales bacterium]|nr:ABC transporter ATP-binding protein [Desulfobacterales bacterium]